MPKNKVQDKLKLYTIHVSLAGSDPEIWRRITVPGNIALSSLHYVIQAVMGWEDCHLHQFMFGRQIVADKNQWDDFDDFQDSNEHCLMDFITRKGQKFMYEYDMGDGWLHICKVEATKELPGKGTNLVCLDGANACPPEDSGGIGGYYYKLEAINDPNNESHNDYLEWLGEDFDPSYFNLEKVNKRLKKIKLK